MTTTPDITLLYDGECPMCCREVDMLARRDDAGRLGKVDIADPAFDASAYGLELDDVHRHMHGLLADGTVVRGMEVFRRAYAAVGLGWITAPTGWPILRPLFDLGYRIFARFRVPIGRLFGRSCPDEACDVRAR